MKKTLNPVSLMELLESNKTLMYPQDGLVINVIEDCPVDLTRLQGDPVQHWQPELGLDRLLYLHRCTAGGERKRERERQRQRQRQRER